MSTTTADPSPELAASTWRVSAPHVRKALAFVKRKGSVTAEELVAWDGEHGRRLFDWDDPHAAEEWRRQQARCFLNRFRQVFEGMRVRAFIHISEDADVGIDESAYVTIEEISKNTEMRAQVVEDIMRRMKSMASELKLWKLSPKERADLFQRISEAMSEKAKAKAA